MKNYTVTNLGDGFRFYGEGWDAFANGEDFRPSASLAWRNGYLDHKMHDKQLVSELAPSPHPM